MKIDLSEFLPKKDSLDEFLPPAVQLPTEVLSPPELIELRWLKQLCSCGREYTAQEFQPLVRHTISRRIGFGLREIGKVYIPLLPNLDVSELPQHVVTREERIFQCPACLGQKPSLDLFPDQSPTFIVKTNGDVMSPHVARWFEMHKTSRQFELHETLTDMHRRSVDFDDLLGIEQ